MTGFKDRIQHYEQIKREKEAGKFHYIPFDNHLPRLSKYVPGIIPGIGYQILANSGVGKSKLLRFMFLQIPYDFVKSNPDSGITFKFIINALEESTEELIDSFVINRIQRKYGINLSINDLNGYSSRTLTDKIIQCIHTEREYFADLEKHMIILNEGNPFGFYKKVREYAEQNGKFYSQDDTVLTDTKKGWKTYIPDNPNEIVICASDHIWLYSAESKMSKYESVQNLSSYYQRQIMNLKFGYATVIVQQQESNKEKKEFTYTGQNIVEKLEPDLSSGGDIKILQRDQLVIFGLFSPYRYKIPEYRGYNIKELKDSARFLFVLKNRRGREGLIDPLFFNGAAETFEELPLPYTDEEEPSSNPALIPYYRKAKSLNDTV